MRIREIEDRFDRWFESLSVDWQHIVAISPLLLVALMLTIVAFVFG